MLIESHICRVDWHNNGQPWVTLNGRFTHRELSLRQLSFLLSLCAVKHKNKTHFWVWGQGKVFYILVTLVTVTKGPRPLFAVYLGNLNPAVITLPRSIAISLCVCLSVRQPISGTAGPISKKCCVRILRGRGSVLLWRLCDSYELPVLWMTSRLVVMGRMAMRGRLNSNPLPLAALW